MSVYYSPALTGGLNKPTDSQERGLKMKAESGRGGTNRQKSRSTKCWLNSKQIKAISDKMRGEAKIVFQLMTSTGQRFNDLAEVKWEDCNFKASTIKIGNVLCRIPFVTSKILKRLKKSRGGESGDYIIKKRYQPIWKTTSTTFYALDIDQEFGCLKRAKMTFARRHFLIYKCKKKLAQAMNLSSVRRLPAEIFKTNNLPICLVQF